MADYLVFCTPDSTGFSSAIVASSHASMISNTAHSLQIGLGTLESNAIDTFSGTELKIGANAAGGTPNATKVTLGGATTTVELAGTLLPPTNSNVVIKMADDGGTYKVSFTDSGDGEVARIDSNGNAQFDGTLTVDGDVTFNGTTTTIGSATLDIGDNLILVNTAAASGYDAGVLVERFQDENDAGTGDVVSDTAAASGTSTAGDGTHITLQVGSSAVDNYYNGWWIKLTNDSPAGTLGDVRQIVDYVGATRVAEVSGWSTNPDATTTYNLYDRPYVGTFYDESADAWTWGATAEDPGAAPVVITAYVDGRMGDTLHLGGVAADITSRTATLSFHSGTGAAAVDKTIGLDASNSEFDFSTAINVTGAITGSNGMTLTAAGITMTGLDLGAAGAEIGDLFTDGRIRFGESTTPGNVASKGFMYFGDDGGDTELFMYSDSGGGAEIQITKDGSLNASAIPGSSLDAAYNNGSTITVDGGAIILETGPGTVIRANDDLDIAFGTGSDWKFYYDETTDDAMKIDGVTSAGDTAGTKFWILGSSGGPSTAGAGGAGGQVAVYGGYGGDSGANGVAGVGGGLLLEGGEGGIGDEGNARLGGIGGDINITAGIGGNGTASYAAGAGGNAVVLGGDGGTSSGVGGAGGYATLDAGAGTGAAADGNVYIGNGNAVAIAWGNAGNATTLTQTGTGQVTFSGNVDANVGLDIAADNQSLTIGAGTDFSISHDATNTTMTSATGDLIIDNTLATGSTIARLGTDTSATDFQVQNNSVGALFTVTGAGLATFAGNVDATAGLDVTTAALTTAAGFSQTGGTFGIVGTTVAFDPTSTFAVNMDSLQTATFTISDNLADAFLVQVGSDAYIDVTTTNAAEIMNFGNTTTNPDFDFLGSGTFTQSGAGQVTFNGNVDAVNGLDVSVAGFTFTGTSIALDPTSTFALNMDASQTATISVADNLADAFLVQQGSDAYIDVTTTDASEAINFGNTTTNPAFNFLGTGQTTFSTNVDANLGVDIPADNQSLTIGAGTDFSIVHNATNTIATSATGDFILDNTLATGSTVMRLGTDTAATDFQVQNNSEGALLIVTGAGVITAAGSMAITTGALAFTGTNIDLDPTGTFDLAMDAAQTVTVTLADNLANSLLIQEGANAYLDITTTDASEHMEFGNTTTNPNFVFLGSGDVDLNTDNQSLKIGAGADFSVLHNGTNTVATSTTGNLIFDNTNATGATIVQLGTDTDVTDFQVHNDTGNTLFEIGGLGSATFNVGDDTATAFLVQERGAGDDYILVDTSNAAEGISLGNVVTNPTLSQLGTGQVTFSGNIDAANGIDITVDNKSLTIGAGTDFTIIHDATNTTMTSATGDLILDNTSATGSTILQLGTDTSDTSIEFKDNTGNIFFTATGDRAIDIDAAAASSFSVTGAGLTLETITSGTLSLDSAGVITVYADSTLSLATIVGSAAGPELDITAANGAAGTFAGGLVDINAGIGGVASGAGAPGGAGGEVNINAGSGGAGNTADAAGAGAAIDFSSGLGGAGGTTGDAGEGGAFYINAGTGGESGSADGTEVGGAGGGVILDAGVGGAGKAASNNDGGTGGDFTINSGAGGAKDGTGADGSGGMIKLNSEIDYLELGNLETETLSKQVRMGWGTSTPANGTGYGKGSIFIKVDTGVLYINTGTEAAVTWTIVGTQST